MCQQIFYNAGYLRAKGKGQQCMIDSVTSCNGMCSLLQDCNTNKTCEDYSDLGFFCVNPWHCKYVCTL